jgi:hypothetical protein
MGLYVQRRAGKLWPPYQKCSCHAVFFALTAGVTLLIVLLMFGTAFAVGKGRHRYGVQAPAVTATRCSSGSTGCR